MCIGSTIFSLVLATLNGELGAGINFLINNGSVPTWLAFIAFCTFGFAGANFSTALTQHYGSLVNGISNTFRKALTLALSFLLFPDRNHLTPHKIFGVIVFFCGLLLRVFMKGESNIKVKSGESSQNDKPNLPRTHMSSGSLVDKEILLKATSLAEDDCKDEADLYTHLGTDIVNGGSLVSNRTSSTASNSSPDSLDGRSDTV